jgi:Fructose-2,6-bisphosphatase
MKRSRPLWKRGHLNLKDSKAQMSQLLYFRHAQASYGKPDYDQLSPLGYRQSKQLGLALVQRKVAFDHVYVGPLKRHNQTLSTVRDEYAKSDLNFPEPITINELEEHRGPEILKSAMQQIKNFDPQINQWDEERIVDPTQNVKKGLLIFDRAMTLWATGKLSHLQPEEYLSWQDFRKNVAKGYETILERHKNERGVTIGLFTSGGTISATMGHILGMAEEKDIIGLNGIVQNTSISSFLFSGLKTTLKNFNDVSHLPQEMKTYV